MQDKKKKAAKEESEDEAVSSTNVCSTTVFDQLIFFWFLSQKRRPSLRRRLRVKRRMRIRKTMACIRWWFFCNVICFIRTFFLNGNVLSWPIWDLWMSVSSGVRLWSTFESITKRMESNCQARKVNFSFFCWSWFCDSKDFKVKLSLLLHRHIVELGSMGEFEEIHE